ncbi:cupin (plasmid) [Microvirga ossetica]|uniref:Cupin n=1 Tax=Microvirga ossetica TaxID=1882682 RepID=A0A1B2EU17_9HYPH|nr:cupin domain-containing protein [Microvirga ossetica]ANY83470.1 cupin [Microvirga ossetica]
MRIVDHAGQEWESWRPGVLTRMRVSALTGAAQLCVFEQWCEPGCGAPTHLHAVEEVLTVVAGQAEVWVNDERAIVTAGQSVIVPAGYRHGFRSAGETTLHVEATLAAPMFEAAFDDLRETRRRWLPDPIAPP